MSDYRAKERRSRRRLLLIACLLFVVALLVSIWWMGPAPPREIVMATGEPEGVYAAVGKEYQQRLDKMGLTVKLVHTQGSMENLKLLIAKKVDVALVQAGTYTLIENEVDRENLRGLVAIQWEPVWLFYRRQKQPLLHLFELNALFKKHKGRIAVGAKNSGTAVLALDLLKANGITKADADFLPLSMTETSKQLRAGKIDAGFFVSSARNHIIQQLLRDDKIQLFSFGRQMAYSRRFPYLSPVSLGEGVVDLENNLPAHEIKMFATPTLMICREDLHPQAVEQILMAARRIHNKPALVSNPQAFPTLQGLDLPSHETAQAYMLSGESLVTRMLPYWGVWLLFKVQILLLPLLVIWLPFFRVFPMVYSFRINMLLRRHYIALREIEDAIEKTDDVAALKEQIEALDNLRKDIEHISRKIPVHLQINVYQWRLHVSHVRSEAQDRLWQFEMEKRMPQSQDDVTK